MLNITHRALDMMQKGGWRVLLGMVHLSQKILSGGCLDSGLSLHILLQRAGAQKILEKKSIVCN